METMTQEDMTRMIQLRARGAEKRLQAAREKYTPEESSLVHAIQWYGEETVKAEFELQVWKSIVTAGDGMELDTAVGIVRAALMEGGQSTSGFTRAIAETQTATAIRMIPDLIAMGADPIDFLTYDWQRKS